MALTSLVRSSCSGREIVSRNDDSILLHHNKVSHTQTRKTSVLTVILAYFSSPRNSLERDTCTTAAAYVIAVMASPGGHSGPGMGKIQRVQDDIERGD